jgi:hypothetical protein
MSIPVTITLNTIVGTPGPFSLYSCIESTCSGSLTPFVTGVSLSDLQTGSLVPDISGNTPTYVKIKSTGGSCAYEIIKPITGIPTVTPTPTPTITPTPGSTSTPTPTPTPTATTGTCVPKEYNITANGNFYWIDCEGNDRYSYFTTADSPICICSSSNLPISLDGGTGTLAGGGCECNPVTPTPTPTVTPTPTPTPNYYNVKVKLVGMMGTSGNLTVRQSSDGITFINSVTITTTDNDVAQQSFNGTPGYYYYFIVARTSGNSDRLNWYTQVFPSDFNPGSIADAGCTSLGGATLQSETFQLPNPTQSVSEVLFYGDISDACL